jgi:zinc transport system permease protein
MLFGVLSVVVGLSIAYYADLAPGGAIVLVAAGAFLAVNLVSVVRSRLGTG